MSTSYSQPLKRISGTALTASIPSATQLQIQRSTAQKLIEDMGFSISNIKVLNRDKQEVSNNINAQFIGPDGITNQHLRNTNVEMYNKVQKQVAMTGSFKGSLLRMSSAFKDYKETKFSEQDIMETLEIFDYNYTDDVKAKIDTLFKADHPSQLPTPIMDMDSSAGLYYQHTSNLNPKASNITKKKDVPLEDMIADASEILSALNEGDTHFSQFIDNNPGLFTLSLRSKEQVVDRETAGDKARPYYSCSYPLNFIASSIFQIIQEAIVGFWHPKSKLTNSSAYKFSFMLMEDLDYKRNGSEALIDWMMKTQKAQSIMYGDDSFVSWREGKDIKYAAPDVSHLDMSLGPHFRQTLRLHIRNFFIKSKVITPNVYDKSWVKRFVNFYTNFCFTHLVLTPFDYLVVKNKGFASGLPGVTLIDMYCMSHFHVRLRRGLDNKKTFSNAIEEAAKFCGFIVKPETLEEKVFQYKQDGILIDLPFLGGRVGWYHYDLQPKKSALVPYFDSDKLAASMVYTTTVVPKNAKLMLQFARLMGLCINCFNNKMLFTVCLATLTQIKNVISLSQSDDTLRVFPNVERFSVSKEEQNTYLKKYIGKDITEINLPTVLPIFALFTTIDLSKHVEVASQTSAPVVQKSLFGQLFVDDPVEDDENKINLIQDVPSDINRKVPMLKQAPIKEALERLDSNVSTPKKIKTYVEDGYHVSTKIFTFDEYIDIVPENNRKKAQKWLGNTNPNFDYWFDSTTKVYYRVQPGYKPPGFHAKKEEKGKEEEVPPPPNIPPTAKSVSFDDQIDSINEHYSDFSKILEYVHLKNKFKDSEVTKHVDILIGICKIDNALQKPPFSDLGDEELEYFEQKAAILRTHILKIKERLFTLIDKRIKELSKKPEIDNFFNKLSEDLEKLSRNISWGDHFNTEKLNNMPDPQSVPSSSSTSVAKNQKLKKGGRAS